MWIAKIRLRHDCIIGNRCKKFKVILQSYNLNEQVKKQKTVTSSIHQMIGKKERIEKFIVDLKKDKRTEYVEVNKNTLFLIESAKNKPVSEFNKQMFFVKPVIVDRTGDEHWEIASHRKEEIMMFISKVKPVCERFSLLSIKNTKLDEVYFPKMLPRVTEKQKRALEMAVEDGYYEVPKKTNLRALAKRAGISLATYQRHLQKAESKVMPDILSFLK